MYAWRRFPPIHKKRDERAMRVAFLRKSHTSHGFPPQPRVPHRITLSRHVTPFRSRSRYQTPSPEKHGWLSLCSTLYLQSSSSSSSSNIVFNPIFVLAFFPKLRFSSWRFPSDLWPSYGASSPSCPSSSCSLSLVSSKVPTFLAHVTDTNWFIE